VSQQNETQPALADGTTRIDLLSLGYPGLPASARQSGAANLSLDFLDSDHVLVTFNPKRMFQRLPDCPATHNDRLIHAAILKLPSGQVVKETDWYLHDSLRYLWPLGSGHFLLRRLNRLYEVDSSFEEKLILDSPEELHWVSVTPDGRQIIAETIDVSASRKNKAPGGQPVKISFLDASSLAVQRVMRSKNAIRLGATSSGFADVVHTGGSTWLVRFGPGMRDRTNITRVRSRVAPNILYGTANTLMIGRCSPSKGGYRMSAFTVTGTHLWKQSWNECRYTPVSKGSEDGNRVAIVTATIRSASTSSADAQLPDSAEEGLEQDIQVIETASGKAVLTARAEQAVLDGANVSLSPDGMKLAVLDGSAIVLFSLQAVSDDDRAKYLALKSDIPPPTVPLPATDRSATEEEIDISGTGADATDQQASSVANLAEPPAGQSASMSAVSADATVESAKAIIPAPTLTLHTGTQLVALDVVVTDSHGRLVKGLEQSDFVVAENGKPQTVRQFREYANGLTTSEAGDRDDKAEQKVEKLPPNLFSNFNQPASPRSVTVVLFDLLNTPLPDQTHARNELLKALKSKPKDSQFALCLLSDKLQMIQGFTQDDAALMAAMRSKKALMRHKSHLDSDLAMATLEAGKTTAEFRPELEFFVQSTLLQESQVRGFDADRRMSVTVDAFAQLARYLSTIPGRKNLIWLSGSFTLGISPDSLPPDREQMAFTQVRNYSENLKKVSNLLAESHVALYPVDVKGLATDPLFTAQTNDVLSPISMTGSTPLGPAQNGRVNFARPADTAIPLAMMQNQENDFASAQIGEHSTMDRLANQTGGRAFYNTNGIAKAIDTAVEEGSNYYALSYSPANKDYNGAFRKIKVSLVNKKHHLAYREGYYAVDPGASVKPAKDLISGLAQAAMQQGSPQSRQIVLAARIIPLGKPRVLENTSAAKPPKGKRKKDAGPEEMQLYSIDYAVKPADLRFSATADGAYHGVLNFMITAFDEDGKLSTSQISELEANFKPEFFRETMKDGLRLHQEVEIPSKSIAMRLGVEDAATSHIGTIEVSLPVKAPPGERSAVHRSLPTIEADE
jgi:VWFA-related protein